MLAAELRKMVLRLRTWILVAALCGVCTLFMFAVRGSSHNTSGGNPVTFAAVRLQNGSAMPFATLFVVSTFFLPLAVGVVAGDGLAGEAAGGTLRYLLVRPVGRARLYLSKMGMAAAFAAMSVLAVMTVGLVGGLTLFDGFHPVALPRARSIVPVGRSIFQVRDLAAGEYIGRLGLAAGYVIVIMLALAAVGLFAGLIIESSGGAVAVVVGFIVVSGILSGLDSLRSIHPALLPSWFVSWLTVFESPIDWSEIAKGMAWAAGYIVVFLGAGIALFRRRDVLS